MPIYVNFSKDIIFLQAVEGDNIRSIIQAMSKDDRKMIQHLVINDPSLLRDFRDRYLTKLLRPLVSMPRLRQLFMVRIHAWLTWDDIAEAETQHILFKGCGGWGRRVKCDASSSRR
jgi:hypothetical protein